MTAPNPREVLELANEIVKLEDQISTLKKRWESLFSSSASAQVRSSGGRPPREDSTTTQVSNLIIGDGTRDWNAQEISEHLKVERGQVESALYNLRKAGKIERTGRGRYTVANPYAAQIDAQLELEKTHP